MRMLLLMAALVPTAAHADALQEQVVAEARAIAPTAFAFTQTTRVERAGADTKMFVSRYDPTQPVAQRWTLVAVDGKPPSAKQVAGAAKAARGQPVPSYSSVAKWFGAPATRIAQGPSSVTYRFARLPKGVVMIGKHDASADTAAEALVDTSGRVPVVTRVRYLSSTAFRMALVIKVDRYVFVESFGAGPDGRPVPEATTGEMAGSLLGKSGTLTTHTSYSDVRAAR
ncbi:hypothetical protein [Sphingomonas oligophenolica]|uniref:DUF4833 domain-containing protein n=1 Tax=Sphingomonas oligophenolica TaxID=301154 RepID=A0A502CF85_9SPHN|nr:hypothetical protein [Sphingomonas oligophenolica]TPG10416.1 hypothetical protein EAH84_12600 [Sphingomonas oligophenolica]